MQLLWVPAFTSGHMLRGFGGEVLEPRWEGGGVHDGQQRAEEVWSLLLLLPAFRYQTAAGGKLVYHIL